jgi:hypothetical protein
MMALFGSGRSPAAAPPSGLPSWLEAHIGEGRGQIARVVLERARALYLKELNEGTVKNPCYFAMDATRPNDPGAGRFYVICEAAQSFRAIASGHGRGRRLGGVLNFENGRECARNFGNALDSELTAGGAYNTAETKTSFKGYYRVAGRHDAVLVRSFVQFEGQGEAANARERAIGGHPAVVLKGICRRRDPKSPYADPDGYVPFGKMVDYAGGRSNGCTSWSQADAQKILAMIDENPTTVYIYPESHDIEAVAHAIAGRQPIARAGLYWNASCLKQIRSPKFWAKDVLEPLLAKYRKDPVLPELPPRPAPICAAR